MSGVYKTPGIANRLMTVLNSVSFEANQRGVFIHEDRKIWREKSTSMSKELFGIVFVKFPK